MTTKLLRWTAGRWVLAFTFLAGLVLTGCRSSAPVFLDPSEVSAASPVAGTRGTFRVGDLVIVVYSGNELVKDIPPHSERVKENGMITLPMIGDITAVGKTAGQLQKEIHAAYVPKIYKQLTITVRGEARYYYIDGEVKSSGQREYPGEMTIVKAISTAGGFTDFAKRWKVRLTRSDGHTEVINVDKAIVNPELDVPVYPGDKIFVPRRWF